MLADHDNRIVMLVTFLMTPISEQNRHLRLEIQHIAVVVVAVHIVIDAVIDHVTMLLTQQSPWLILPLSRQFRYLLAFSGRVLSMMDVRMMLYSAILCFRPNSRRPDFSIMVTTSQNSIP